VTTHVCPKCHREWRVAAFPFNCVCRHQATSANPSSIIRKLLGLGQPTVPAQSRLDCIHRGELLRLETCSECRGKIEIKVFECAKHGACAISKRINGVAMCDHCHTYQKYRDITTRNLIYHVCPLRNNDGWRHNLALLARRLDAFNGKRIIAIATGDECESSVEVHRELSGLDYECILRPNDPELREVATFADLLQVVANTNNDEATFYAHSKGNSTAGAVDGAQRWTSTMYHELLDDGKWQRCMEHLKTHAAVGINKMVWDDKQPPYPSRLRHGKWMFSGTFWWIRHDVAFGHDNWSYVPRDRYGAEAWPSGVIDEWWRVKSVFQPWPETQYPTPSPYDPSLYPEKYDEEWR